MKFLFLLFIIFNCLLFSNEFLNPEILDYTNILYMFLIIIFCLIIFPLFIKKEVLFNKIIQYKSDDNSIKFIKINNRVDKNKLKKLKKKIKNEFKFKTEQKTEIKKLDAKLEYKNKFYYYDYYFISKSLNNINCEKIDKRYFIDYFHKYLKLNSLDNEEVIYFYKIKKFNILKNKNEISINSNILIYLRILNFLTKIPFLSKIILLLLTLIPILLTIFYIVYKTYFIKILSLIGIIPNEIKIDFSNFLTYIFSEIFILIVPSFTALLGVIPLLSLVFIGLFVLYNSICNIIRRHDIKISSDTLYIYTIFALGINIILYFLSILFLIKLLLIPLITIYKIEYPENKNINLYNNGLFYADYLNFTSKISNIEIDNKYYYSVGYDNVYLYYYDIVENKNKLLSNEIKSSTKNECKQILLNVNLAYNEYINEKKRLKFKKLKKEEVLKINNKIKRAKLNSLLINNNILNTSLIKKRLIKNINIHKELSFSFGKELNIDEIINKCNIIVTLKNIKNINYKDFEKFNDNELIFWIDNLNLDNDTIKKLEEIKKKSSLYIIE